MKRMIAMLLAMAALVCCAGCGGSGGGAATTMTEEDYYVYENGEVVMTISEKGDGEALIDHTFTEKEETKRGIHIGSTLEEAEQAYKGEPVAWWASGEKEYKIVRLGQGNLKGNSGLLSLNCLRDMDGNFQVIDESNGKGIEKQNVYWMNMDIQDRIVTEISIYVSNNSNS